MWFKVDDKFWSHRKIRALSSDAISLWVRAGSYCGDHLTDGIVEPSDIAFIGGEISDAEELVDAGLWLRHERGYVFHEWELYQPTRAKVEAEREAAKERARKLRERKRNTSSSLPDPTRPQSCVTNGERSPLLRPNAQPADPTTVAAALADIRNALGGRTK